MLCKTGSWGMPGERQAVTRVTQDAVCVYFPLEQASVGPRGLMRCGKLEKKPLSWLNPMEMHAIMLFLMVSITSLLVSQHQEGL